MPSSRAVAAPSQRLDRARQQRSTSLPSADPAPPGSGKSALRADRPGAVVPGSNAKGPGFAGTSVVMPPPSLRAAASAISSASPPGPATSCRPTRRPVRWGTARSRREADEAPEDRVARQDREPHPAHSHHQRQTEPQSVPSRPTAPCLTWDRRHLLPQRHARARASMCVCGPGGTCPRRRRAVPVPTARPQRASPSPAGARGWNAVAAPPGTETRQAPPRFSPRQN